MGMFLYEYDSVLSPWGHEETDFKWDFEGDLSLPELLAKQERIEKWIDELRAAEPPMKRGRTLEYKVWVDVVQNRIDDLQEVRDKIIKAKGQAPSAR